MLHVEYPYCESLSLVISYSVSYHPHVITIILENIMATLPVLGLIVYL